MFTKQTTIGEVLECGEAYQPVFEGFGMHCFSCPLSRMETIEEAAAAHGVSVDLMLEKLNEVQTDKGE